MANSFVGREADLARVAAALVAHPVTTITGMAGVGKTRLALESLHRIAADRPGTLGETRWADLGGLPHERQLVAALAHAVGFADHTTGVALDALTTWLSGRRFLLVLDSCEHLVAACADLVGELLAACPDLRILATSRQRLGLPGERAVHIAPLPADGEALTLFLDRALAVAPALSLRTPRQNDSAREICALLDGVPLALELASAQLMHTTLPELSERLSSRRVGLMSPTWPARHRSLRLAIGWSHELCEPLERLLWARLSVFPGSFDSRAARGVCAGGPLSAAAVDTALAGLTGKSVVSREDGDRYRLPRTVRDYGAMWLEELQETEATAARHALYFLDHARSADQGWAGPGQLLWYRRIGAAHVDLCAALDHLCDHDPPAAVELAALLGFFWVCCGHLREARAYLEQVLCLRPGFSRAGERAQWALGVVKALQGDLDGAAAIGRRCAHGAERLDDAEARLAAAYLIGLTRLLAGEPGRAKEVADAALAVAGAPPFTSASTLRCHLVRVFALTALGSLDLAHGEAVSLRALCAAHGEHWTRAYSDQQLALIALAQGRPAHAAEHARAMLTGMRHLGDTFGIALGMDVLAAAAAARGLGEPAALAAGAGQTYWAAVGHAQRGTPELGEMRRVCRAEAVASIGEYAFQLAFRRGAEGDPDAVLRLAVSGQLLGKG
ncbi:ATP-binding protein [Streptomyces sp. NPDC127108]|uniref:ATP-binding protein n=1 Tax=Streptomyces sp. NPDC127108 TaxID=3345361 RepID=UPI003642CA39